MITNHMGCSFEQKQNSLTHLGEYSTENIFFEPTEFI